MSEQQQSNQSNKAKVGKTKQKRTNKAADDAASKFNDNASPMSASQFFSSWEKDTYVDTYVTQETTLLERLSETDTMVAREAGKYDFRQENNNVDFQSETFAMDGLALARKMLISVPASENFEMGPFRDLVNAELYAPANYLAAVSHVGKFTKDDKVVRIRYNSQDIVRILLKVSRQMSLHSEFNGLLPVPHPDPLITWQNLNMDKVVTDSESSVFWLLDQSKTLLEAAYGREWIVPVVVPGIPDPVEMRVSYPSFPVPFGQRLTVRQFLGWAANLNQHMPHLDMLLASAATACWEKRWFEFIDTPFQEFLPGIIPAWFGQRTPQELLDLLEYKFFRISQLAQAGFDGYVTLPDQIRVITNHVQAQRIKFTRYFNMVKQGNDVFGTQAQLIVFKQDQLVVRPSQAFPGNNYYVVGPNQASRALHPIQDKGDTAAGLIFIFTTDMKEMESWRAQANMDSSQARKQYLVGDIKMTR